MEEKYAIGIDFGTTYSCTGVWTNGGVVIIPNGIGERTTPSVIIFESKTKIYVGEETLNHLSKKNTVKIYEIKRLIGKKYDEIKDLIDYFSFQIEKEKNTENILIKITLDNGEILEFYPEILVGCIFKRLISNAELFLNQKITDIVITVPADFTDLQRHAIKYAAQLNPGIKVHQIINEPSAAALAACFLSLNKIRKNPILNFDKNNKNINNSLLVSESNIMNINNSNNININSTNNININNSNNVNINNSNNRISLIDEKDNSLNAPGFINNNLINDDNFDTKHILVFDFGGGTYDVSLIEIEGTFLETISSAGDQRLGGGDLDNKLMEFCLDNFSENIKIDKNIIKQNYKSIQRLKIACEQTKKILSLTNDDKIYIEDFYKEESLNIVITRAKFEELCKEYFDKLIPPLDTVISDAKKKVINKFDEIILVGGSSKIPKIKEILSEKFPNIPLNDSFNPDEAVAYGAALFCEKLVRNNNEFLKDFDYFDATQHSYGIEIEDGIMEILIPRGSKYPMSVTKFYHNYYNDQISFDIKVYEGENKYCKDNKFLAKFTLENLPKMKKGELICEVKFSINIDQIIKVDAYVGNDISRGIIISNDNPFTHRKKVTLIDIDPIDTNLNEKEKKFKSNIIEYMKNINEMSNDEEKYILIKNYNNAIIEYMVFLSDKFSDFESEKYIRLVETLFKSYTNLYTSNIHKKINDEDKKEIDLNIKKYLTIINLKNPFRLKQLLKIFQDITLDVSNIFYSASIFSMDLLNNKADLFFELKIKKPFSIAKNLYEESLSIAESYFKDIKILNLLPHDLKMKFQELKEKSEKNIKIISIYYFKELENTINTGNLFSNTSLDYDNLCLLSFNFAQCIKKINSIENIYNNKELLEAKSICLANIVKIEFLMKKRRLSLQNLLDHANESINLVDNNLGNKYIKKNWYNEIVQLKKDIEKYLESNKKDSMMESEKMRQELNEKFYCGDEEFIKFLLYKYHYPGFDPNKNNINFIEEFQKNRRSFLKKLISLYRGYDNRSTPLGPRSSNNDLTQQKEIILEYLTNLLNSIT